MPEEGAHPRYRCGEVDRAEDEHAARRRVRRHEQGEVIAHPLAVVAVVHRRGSTGGEHAADVVGDRRIEALEPESA